MSSTFGYFRHFNHHTSNIGLKKLYYQTLNLCLTTVFSQLNGYNYFSKDAVQTNRPYMPYTT
jgi:hypothetical protein